MMSIVVIIFQCNSGELLFSGLREAPLRDAGKRAPQSLRDRNEPSMVIGKILQAGLAKDLNCFYEAQRILDITISRIKCCIKVILICTDFF